MNEEERKKGRKVLIAVEGSEGADEAFHWYVEQFHRPNDLVLLTHVQDHLLYTPVTPYPYSFANAYYEDWVKEIKTMKQCATNLMNSYVQKCKAHNLRFRTILKAGRPENVICETVTEEEADVVIVGSRGQGVLRRTLMGSVSTYCVHHAHVPVIVVPHRDRHKLHGINNACRK